MISIITSLRRPLRMVVETLSQRLYEKLLCCFVVIVFLKKLGTGFHWEPDLSQSLDPVQVV